MIASQKDIGGVFVVKTDAPCIPNTYQVGSIHTAEDFDRKGYGTLLYDIAFLVAGSKGAGLTSDRMTGTRATARDIWADIEANDAKYEKRKTRVVDLDDPEFTDEQNSMLRRVVGAPEDVSKIGGNDTFDYNRKTLDPDDDCRRERFSGTNATDHSFIMKDMSAIKAVYDKLKSNHEQLIKIINDLDPTTDDAREDGRPNGHNVDTLLDTISHRTAENFGARYSSAKDE